MDVNISYADDTKFYKTVNNERDMQNMQNKQKSIENLVL